MPPLRAPPVSWRTLISNVSLFARLKYANPLTLVPAPAVPVPATCWFHPYFVVDAPTVSHDERRLPALDAAKYTVHMQRTNLDSPVVLVNIPFV